MEPTAENPFLTALIPLGFFIVFPLFWIFISFLISRLGGWANMAAAYTERNLFSPTCWHFQSAILSLSMGYNNVLNVCADDEGVRFAPIVFFRLGHRPICVPWDEISGTEKQYFIYRVVDLRFAQTPNYPFRIYKRLADKLVDASGGRWRYTQN